jgi:hypothetical protein
MDCAEVGEIEFPLGRAFGDALSDKLSLAIFKVGFVPAKVRIAT